MQCKKNRFCRFCCFLMWLPRSGGRVHLRSCLSLAKRQLHPKLCHNIRHIVLDTPLAANYQPHLSTTQRPAAHRRETKGNAGVAQLVRVSACHAEGRGFEPRHSRHPCPNKGIRVAIAFPPRRDGLDHDICRLAAFLALTLDDRLWSLAPRADLRHRWALQRDAQDISTSATSFVSTMRLRTYRERRLLPRIVIHL